MSARPDTGMNPSVPQLMQQAASLYREGGWQDAEGVCRTIIDRQPDHAGALSLLGVITARTGRVPFAAELFAKVVASNPDDAHAQNNYGNTLRDLGRVQQALESYGRAVAAKPDFAEAHHNRGVALHHLRRVSESLESYEHALRIRPGYAEAHYNRANALKELGREQDALAGYEAAILARPDFIQAMYNRANTLRDLQRDAEALDEYERVIRLRPDFAAAYGGLGAILRRLKRPEDALRALEHGLSLNPNGSELHNTRGNVLQNLERFEDALESYRHSLAIDPQYADALNNRGSTLHALRRFDEALASYRQALAVRPNYPEAFNNCGLALHDLRRYEDALLSFDCAIAARSTFAEAYSNRALTLRELGRLDESTDSYARALLAAPQMEWLYGIWLHARMKQCAWDALDLHRATLTARIAASEPATTPFPVLALIDNPAIQRQAAQIWAQQTCPERNALGPIGARERKERIRVGYYSADFYTHATSHLITELFERHDRSNFEVFAFSFGPALEHDAARQRVRGAVDRFLDVRMKSDKEVAQLSRELGIDIAVDLKGFTYDQRPGIFAQRAAPIQVSYLGYPGTMGAPYIDYLIADTTLIPTSAREHYAEKIIYLPHSYQANDRKRPIAVKLPSRAELGLPAEGFVFCSFSNPYKITPEVFDIWLRLLQTVPRSVLWLLEDNPTATSNLRKETQRRGLDSTRLVFAPKIPLPEHLARHQAADLFLDTWPCNAHTTASDALWAGLPLLTRCGQSFAARVAASVLNAIGLPELITYSPEDYEARALELATNPDRLQRMRRHLADNRLSSPLFDSASFTRHLEDAYRTINERHYAGLPPGDLSLVP
jgi:protein O-GlcNAc transferase